MPNVRGSMDPDAELALRGRPLEIPAVRIEFVPPAAPGANNPRETPLLSLFGLLQRKKSALLSIAVVCAAAGFAIGLCQTPKYRAVAVVEIEGNSDPAVLLQGLLPSGNFSGNGIISDAYVETRARLVQEPALVETALTRLDWPASIANSQNSAMEKARRLAGLPEKPLVTDHQVIKSEAIANLDVHVPPQSHLIEIAFEGNDPRTSAAVANALGEALIEHDLNSRWKSAQAVSEWLAGPLQEFKAKYERSATALQDYAQKSGLMVNTDKKTTVAEDSLYQLQEELSRAVADRIAKQSRYELAKSSPQESLPEVLDNGPLREYQLKLADLKRQLTELESTFTGKFPKVAAMKAQIADLTATIAKERQNVLNRLKNEYESAARREQLVSQEFGSSAGHVADQSAVAIRYDVLKREMDANRTIYESMLQKEKEAGIAAALRTSNIRVVSPAQPPSGPYSPKPMLNAALAGIAGLFFSFVFLFTRQHMVRSFRNPGELGAVLQMAELGMIPSVPRPGFLGAPWRAMRRWLGPASTSKEIEIFGRGGARPLKRLPKPAHLETTAAVSSEALLTVSTRSILASLWFKEHAGRNPRIVLVSSARRGEGKTTLATNLAILLAQTNRRVLLIDGNLRNPRVHTLFGLPNTWGLSSLLDEDVPVESYEFEELASRTNVPGLYVLPAGPSPQQVSTLQYHERLEELIARCRIEFHAVFIDTPPALDFSPDARILGSLSDGVILAVKADETRQEEVEFACRVFREDKTHVLGCVLNQWQSAHSRNWRYRQPTSA